MPKTNRLKKTNVILTLEFSDEFNPHEEMPEVIENIKRAIVGECESGLGIAPAESEAYTEKVTVTWGEFSQKPTIKVSHNFKHGTETHVIKH